MQNESFLITTLKKLKDALTRNVPLKVASILIAILLWGYVLYDLNPYREKTISGVSTSFEGEADLLAQGLCIRGDRTDLLKNVDVNVQTRLRNYANLSASSVSASINLRRISLAQEYEIPITATIPASLGYIDSVSPAFVTVEIDNLITKTIPVTCQFVNEIPEGYWADMNSLVYTTSINIEGAKTDLAKVSSAVVTVDLAGKTAPIFSSYMADLLDSDGNVLDSDIVRGSVPSATVRMSVKPVKSVPVDIESALVGADKLAANYELASVSVSPSTVRIVGDETALREVASLTIDPVSVSNASEPMSFESKLLVPEGVSLLDTDTVSVTLDIHEHMETLSFVQKTIEVTGLVGKYSAEVLPKMVDVDLYGPVSVLSVIKRVDLVVNVDVSGLKPGTYELPLTISVKNEKTTQEISIKPSVSTVQVTIE